MQSIKLNKVNSLYIVILFILLGLGLRLVLAQLPAFKIDIEDFYAWAIRLNTVGLPSFYTTNYFTDYPPGYLYILFLLGGIANLFHLTVTQFFYLLKLPSIISEIVLAILVFAVVKKEVSLKWAYIALITILFNPLFLFNSAIWGQIDGLLSLLMFLSLYYLYKNKLIISSIFFAITFITKPQAIAIAPIYLLFLIKDFRFKRSLQLFLPGLITLFILSIPFFSLQSILGLAKLILNTSNEYPYTSLFAYNFWGSIGFWLQDTIRYYSISYQTWGILSFVIYWIGLSFYYLKDRLSLFSLAVLASLAFFFLPTRVHERYLYPAIIFLILTSSLYKSWKMYLLTILMSVVSCLNLYFVYIYYNDIYFKTSTELFNENLYTLLESNGKLLSEIATILFVLLTIIIISINDDQTIKTKIKG